MALRVANMVLAGAPASERAVMAKRLRLPLAS